MNLLEALEIARERKDVGGLTALQYTEAATGGLLCVSPITRPDFWVELVDTLEEKVRLIMARHLREVCDVAIALTMTPVEAGHPPWTIDDFVRVGLVVWPGHPLEKSEEKPLVVLDSERAVSNLKVMVEELLFELQTTSIRGR